MATGIPISMEESSDLVLRGVEGEATNGEGKEPLLIFRSVVWIGDGSGFFLGRPRPLFSTGGDESTD